MASKIRGLGVLTGGGDCPGLNAIVRAAAKTAIQSYDMDVVGVADGFEGLIEDRIKPLKMEDLSGLLPLGGTVLGANNRANPFAYPITLDGKREHRDLSDHCLEVAESRGLDGLIVAGGDGTMDICRRLVDKGLKIVGVPKTIDNDLHGTDWSVGFDTAVNTATFAIDKLHSTAQSHQRVMVVEIMGRYAGWLALESGAAGGADVILLPELPYDMEVICDVVRHRGQRGKRCSIVVVAEGAKPKDGELVVRQRVEDASDPVRLGGISAVLAHQIELCSKFESRFTILGHLQRGGGPSAFDRNLATLLGAEAVHRLVQGEYGVLMGVRGREVITTPLAETQGVRTVPLDHRMLADLKGMGICLGVE